MNKKTRREVVELTLLDDPKNETQVKDKTQKIILRVVLIGILFALLIFGYIFKFSAGYYPKFFSYKFTGVFNSSNYYNVDNCDLIIIKPYKNTANIEEGDIVFFSTNIEEGSGKLVNIDNDVLEIETKIGVVKRVSETSVVGKQYKTIAVLGFFVAFVNSYYGIIAFTLLLIAYVAYITFSRINYENTDHGRMLYKEYKKHQAEEKRRIKLLENLDSNINYDIQKILEGSFEENKQKLLEFNLDKKATLKDKYKYVLSSIHDAYLTKSELTREEVKYITSVVELMCVPISFDEDIEYMLNDLILKKELEDFDIVNFKKSASEFINGEIKAGYMLSFGTVLYILVYKNKKLRNEHMKEIIQEYKLKAIKIEKEEKTVLVGIANSVRELLKK